jgi:hypothetical protein
LDHRGLRPHVGETEIIRQSITIEVSECGRFAHLVKIELHVRRSFVDGINHPRRDWNRREFLRGKTELRCQGSHLSGRHARKPREDAQYTDYTQHSEYDLNVLFSLNLFF